MPPRARRRRPRRVRRALTLALDDLDEFQLRRVAASAAEAIAAGRPDTTGHRRRRPDARRRGRAGRWYGGSAPRTRTSCWSSSRLGRTPARWPRSRPPAPTGSRPRAARSARPSTCCAGPGPVRCTWPPSLLAQAIPARRRRSGRPAADRPRVGRALADGSRRLPPGDRPHPQHLREHLPRARRGAAPQARRQHPAGGRGQGPADRPDRGRPVAAERSSRSTGRPRRRRARRDGRDRLRRRSARRRTSPRTASPATTRCRDGPDRATASGGRSSATELPAAVRGDAGASADLDGGRRRAAPRRHADPGQGLAPGRDGALVRRRGGDRPPVPGGRGDAAGVRPAAATTPASPG